VGPWATTGIRTPDRPIRSVVFTDCASPFRYRCLLRVHVYNVSAGVSCVTSIACIVTCNLLWRLPLRLIVHSLVDLP
jgi:hypothetical protein